MRTEEATGAAQPNGAEPPQKSAGTSLIDEVRAQLKEGMDEEVLDLRLPRKQPRLVVRYGVVEPDDVEGEDVLAINVAIVVHACQGLFVQRQGGALEPLEQDGQPVTYANAAAVLEIDAASAKETVLWLFKGNELALDHHATQVFKWMQNTSLEVEGQVLGESSA